MFSGHVVTSSGCDTSRSEFRGEHTVLICTNESQVGQAVNLAAAADRPLVVQSGTNVTHSKQLGESPIVLDLTQLKSISIAGKSVTAAAGATVAEVAEALNKAQLFLPLGSNPHKSIVSDVLSSEINLFWQSVGPLRDSVASVAYVDNVGQPFVAVRAAPPSDRDTHFDAILQGQLPDAIITSIVFTARDVNDVWMVSAAFPYTEKMFAAVMTAILPHEASAALPLSMPFDLTVLVQPGPHGLASVSVTVSGMSSKALVEAEDFVDKVVLGKASEALVKRRIYLAGKVLRALASGKFSVYSELSSTTFTDIFTAERFWGEWPQILETFSKTWAPDGSKPEPAGSRRLSTARLSADFHLLRQGIINVSARLLAEEDELEVLEHTFASLIPQDRRQKQQRRSLPAAATAATAATATTTTTTAARLLSATSVLSQRVLATPSLLTASKIPEFKGVVVAKGDPAYAKASKQYATSSYPPAKMSPYMVIYPTDEDDVIVAIGYAKDIQKKLVARSGGHQYCGMSSGGDDTIVLSMTHSYFCDKKVGGPKNNIATVGVGVLLTDLATFFNHNGITIPHGECPRVAIGGHVQTGGFGHLLRAFGLALDHVQAFDIVLANGEFKTITRPKAGQAPATDDDKLYWAVLGGGPNSFGILIRIVFECIVDKDYPTSTGHKGTYIFQKDMLREALTVVREWTESDTVPPGMDLCMTVVSDSFWLVHGLFLLELVHSYSTDGKEDADIKQLQNIVKRVTSQSWTSHLSLVDYTFSKGHIPLSDMANSFVRRVGTTRDGREFEYPYKKRMNYTIESMPAEFVNGFTELVSQVVADTSHVKLCFQLFIGGGAYKANGARGQTAICGRNAHVGVVFDVFYKAGQEGKAEQWQSKMEDLLQRTRFGSELRMLWGSYGSTDMKAVWPNYYPDRGTYAQLQDIKRKVDPNDVFHTEFTVQLPDRGGSTSISGEV